MPTVLQNLPAKGFVFWPVGNGDSTTISVGGGVVLQVDVNHTVSADDPEDPRVPIVDQLERLLPKSNGRPYLATFALTHPDRDHCSGFADLLKRVFIGELWFTPRTFTETKSDLSDDARAFRSEALRRVKATIKTGGAAASGDRLRIIGYDEVLNEADFKGFPKARLTVPGGEIVELDGRNLAGHFRAFVHAPFKDDISGERNESSLGLQVTVYDAGAGSHALLLGDLGYPTLNRIFNISDAADLAWNVLLAPHHCSKSAMYWQDEGEKDETLKQPLLDAIERVASSPGYVVSSSLPVPGSNQPGDNPPHAKAKARYSEIAPDGFICTMEHGGEKRPVPVVFDASGGRPAYTAPSGPGTMGGGGLAADVSAARGMPKPPTDRVGFGSCR